MRPWSPEIEHVTVSLMTQADYVVVGAGSAGCAVARRLAESGASVVLVEAGGRDDKGLAKMLFQTPGAISVMHSTPQLKKLFDWGYKSTPQKHAWDRDDPDDPRQGARRLELDQRHAVRARQPQELRRLGRRGLQGLGLRRRAARLQEARGLGGRRHRPARRRTARSRSPASTTSPRPRTRSWTPRRRSSACRSSTTTTARARRASRSSSRASAHGRRYSTVGGLPPRRRAAEPRRAHRGARSRGSSSRAPARPASRSSRQGRHRRSSRATREVIVSAGVFGSRADPHALRHRPGRRTSRDVGIDVGGRPAGRRQPARPPVRADLVPHGLGAPRSPPRRTSSAGWPASGCARAPPGRPARRSSPCAFVRTSHATEIPDLQLLSLYWTYPVPNQDDTDQADRPADQEARAERLPDADLPGEPRHRAARVGRPDRGAAHRPRLPQRPAGHRGARRGHRDGARAHGRRRRQPGRDRPGLAVLQRRRHAPRAARTSCTRSTTRSAPAGWASTSAPSSTPSSRSAASTASASPTPRSCRPITGGNTNAPAMMIGERCAELILG